uniref:Uncharacterized protein n=1 Tax=Arundo donax TaxID=35708 RepID=A0A0A9HAD3_ARUDO
MQTWKNAWKSHGILVAMSSGYWLAILQHTLVVPVGALVDMQSSILLCSIDALKFLFDDISFTCC